MEKNALDLNILFPVYNEEQRLRHGVSQTAAYMEEFYPGRYQITIIDNASTDRTGEIAHELEKKYPAVSYMYIPEKGVGAAFLAGAKKNALHIVGYMDVDLSTDLKHVGEMMEIFEGHEEVGIVNGSRLSRGSRVSGRKKIRTITSHGLKYVLKIVFGMKIDDAICGFKFFRKDTLDRLIQSSGSEKGWFYCIELLLRAERMGIPIVEIPVIWQDDPGTTVHVFKTIVNYLRCIAALKKEFLMKKADRVHADESL